MSMRVLLLTVALITPTHVAAQVVVLVNRDTGGCVDKADVKNALQAAKGEAASRPGGGTWTTLLASTTVGHGAMFAVRHGAKVEFFLVHGRSNLKDAMTEAKAKAVAAANKQTVSSCGIWKNTNKYPPDYLPTDLAIER